jgi:hypothetical protein
MVSPPGLTARKPRNRLIASLVDQRDEKLKKKAPAKKAKRRK